jgi:hypothetical protein
MSFLEDKNKTTNEIDLSGAENVEFEKGMKEGQFSLGKPSVESSESLVLDLDKELETENDKKKNEPEKTSAPAGAPAMNLPKLKPGLGIVGGPPKITPAVDLKKKEQAESVKLPENGVGFGSSFSLLPVDEESILYVDFPAALRRILYTFVVGGVVLVGAWFGSNYYLDKYFVQANDMQQQIRALSLEKLKYQTTDADVRLRYQFYKTLQQLLTNHITWQHFFVLLEKYTAPEVHFTNFSVNIMNDINKIMFSSYASDLKSALKQYMVMKKYASEFCENVTISNLTLLKGKEGDVTADAGVSFNLTFDVKAELFNTSVINSLSKK